jgi:hypothetical protein
MARTLVLLSALLFIGGFAFLTFYQAREYGIDILVVVSFVVLAILAFGVIGALGQKDE